MRNPQRSQMPGIVIAIIALIAAVGGVAAADPFAESSISKKKTKKIATRVANNRIVALAPTLTVKSARSLTMYGQVSSEGVLTNAVGIGGVSKTFPDSFYCLTGLAATPRGGTATVNYNNSLPESDAQLLIGTRPECPAGTGAVVWTHDGPSDFPAGFFVALWP